MAIDYQPIYLLGSGMLLQDRRLSVATNNMSNMNTYAFKKDILVASSWYVDNGVRIDNSSAENPSNNFVYPIVGNIHIDITQGSLIQTNNKLDFAIEGEGFFVVTDGREILYTRKGNFKVDGEGYLVTDLGYRVLTEDGKYIKVTDSMEIDRKGYIYHEGEIVGRLGIVNLENLVKLGEGMFGGNPVPADGYNVYQGFLEASNVDAFKEMVNIIEITRAHEVYSRLIQSFDLIQSKVSRGFRA